MSICFFTKSATAVADQDPQGRKKAAIDFDLNLVEKAAGDYDTDKFLIVRGLASTGEVDRYSDKIAPEAWNSKALKAYKKNPVLLYAHDHMQLIGKVFEIEKTDKGLEVVAGIYKNWEYANRVEDGILKAFSVGFYIDKGGIEYNEEKDIYDIKSVELLEISVVSVPANRSSLFKLSKSFSDDELNDIKKNFIKASADKTQADELNHTNHKNMFEAIKGLFALAVSKLGMEETPIADDANHEELIKSLSTQLEGMTPVSEQIEKAVSDAVEPLNAKIKTLEEAEPETPASDSSEGVETKTVEALNVRTKALEKQVADQKSAIAIYTKTINDLTATEETPAGSSTTDPTNLIADADKEHSETVAGESKY